MLAASVLLMSCEPGAWEEPAIPRTATVCGVDESGSIRPELRAAAREACVRTLQRLEAGWTEVRSINQRSLTNEQSLVRLERHPASCPNNFSARCRAAVVRDSLAYARALDAAVARVREPPAALSRQTDIVGFLAAATQALEADPDAAGTIVMATDLDETVHRRADLDLAGAAIEVWLQQPEDPAAAERRRAEFAAAMRAAGASAVSFYPLPAHWK